MVPWLAVWRAPQQLFFNFFKTLIGKPVVVELKNDLQLQGVLQSVDQYLNLKLDGVSVVNAEQHPQLVRGEEGGEGVSLPVVHAYANSLLCQPRSPAHPLLPCRASPVVLVSAAFYWVLWCAVIRQELLHPGQHCAVCAGASRRC